MKKFFYIGVTIAVVIVLWIFILPKELKGCFTAILLVCFPFLIHVIWKQLKKINWVIQIKIHSSDFWNSFRLTFFLAASTILLSYIFPSISILLHTDSSKSSNLIDIIWSNLHNGNLFLTETTILTSLIYDTWRSAQIKINEDHFSVFNFSLVLLLVSVSILFALIQPLNSHVNDVWVWIEIFLFGLVLYFHYQANSINKNPEKIIAENKSYIQQAGNNESVNKEISSGNKKA